MLAALWQVRAPCSVGGRHPPIPAGTRMQPDKAMRGFVRGFFESIPKLQACRPNKQKGERPAVHPFRRGMTVGCVLVDYDPVADSTQLMLIMTHQCFQKIGKASLRESGCRNGSITVAA